MSTYQLSWEEARDLCAGEFASLVKSQLLRKDQSDEVLRDRIASHLTCAYQNHLFKKAMEMGAGRELLSTGMSVEKLEALVASKQGA